MTGLFFKPKNKNLAAQISISSPEAYRMSVQNLKRGGLSLEEKRALVLARNRAGAFLNRKNLSPKELEEMREIKMSTLPRITRRY